jgi:hypothetical protein
LRPPPIVLPPQSRFLTAGVEVPDLTEEILDDIANPHF